MNLLAHILDLKFAEHPNLQIHQIKVPQYYPAIQYCNACIAHLLTASFCSSV